MILASKGRPAMTSARQRVLSATLVAVVLAGCGGAATTTDAPDTDANADSGLVAEGQELYEATCAACHGVDLTGTDNGPPFLDPIYAPDHHADSAFFAAAAMGVQPHHWDFGPMPRQPVEPDEVRKIVAYIRSIQRAEAAP